MTILLGEGLTEKKKIVFRELLLDISSKTAKIGDRNLDINRQEFGVLQLLLENQNINLLRERIIDLVW